MIILYTLRERKREREREREREKRERERAREERVKEGEGGERDCVLPEVHLWKFLHFRELSLHEP